MNEIDTSQTDDSVELLRIDDVCELTKLSRATIWNKLNPDSKYYDARFPMQFNLSKRAVAWKKQDVIQWINNLPQQQKHS